MCTRLSLATTRAHLRQSGYRGKAPAAAPSRARVSRRLTTCGPIPFSSRSIIRHQVVPSEKPTSQYESAARTVPSARTVGAQCFRVLAKPYHRRMLELVFEVVQESDGGYCAECLTESIFTEGDTWDELRQNVLEATFAFFFDRPRPERVRLHLVRDEVLLVA